MPLNLTCQELLNTSICLWLGVLVFQTSLRQSSTIQRIIEEKKYLPNRISLISLVSVVFATRVVWSGISWLSAAWFYNVLFSIQRLKVGCQLSEPPPREIQDESFNLLILKYPSVQFDNNIKNGVMLLDPILPYLVLIIFCAQMRIKPTEERILIRNENWPC